MGSGDIACTCLTASFYEEEMTQTEWAKLKEEFREVELSLQRIVALASDEFYANDLRLIEEITSRMQQLKGRFEILMKKK